MPDDKKYNLDERTALFGQSIITLCRQMPKDVVTIPLINQLVKSGTSPGANYMEANGSSSRKDFINKIYICLKETKETEYWLRQISHACPQYKQDIETIAKEAHELTLIFSKIAHTPQK